ncbi:MAG: hypothetical protein IPG32_14490 [Saprospirales bacterium]|nr:hypothetical protein [Saprospirales bacterium]
MNYMNSDPEKKEISASNEAAVSIENAVVEERNPLVWVEVNAVEDGEPIIIQFDKPSFKAAIQNGDIKKDQEARLVGTESWVRVEDIAAQSFDLNVLYRPVWAYISQGLFYGAIGGFLLKSMDTFVTFLALDQNGGVAIAFAFLIASLFLAKHIQFLPMAAFAWAGFQYGFFLFGALFTTAVVGIVFGAPLGALIGAIAGYYSKPGLKTAPDREPENPSPFLYGIVAPVLFLAIAIPAYLFWLNPMIINWVTTN